MPRIKKKPKRDSGYSRSSPQHLEDQKCLIGIRTNFHCYPSNPCLVNTINGLRCTRSWQDTIPDFLQMRNVIDLTS